MRQDSDLQPDAWEALHIPKLFWKELAYCEFFAGQANAYKAIRGAGYNSCAVDIEYMDGFKDIGTNPFDILTPAGLAFPTQLPDRGRGIHSCKLLSCFCSCELRLGIWLLLQCKEDEFLTMWGIVCSSWVQTNAGTSKRSILLPEGDTSRRYIRQANAMASRNHDSMGHCMLIQPVPFLSQASSKDVPSHQAYSGQRRKLPGRATLNKHAEVVPPIPGFGPGRHRIWASASGSCM